MFVAMTVSSTKFHHPNRRTLGWQQWVERRAPRAHLMRHTLQTARMATPLFHRVIRDPTAPGHFPGVALWVHGWPHTVLAERVRPSGYPCAPVDTDSGTTTAAATAIQVIAERRVSLLGCGNSSTTTTTTAPARPNCYGEVFVCSWGWQ